MRHPTRLSSALDGDATPRFAPKRQGQDTFRRFGAIRATREAAGENEFAGVKRLLAPRILFLFCFT
jgi:hypothetical protein